MPYTAIYISPATKAHLQQNGLPPLAAGATPGEKPVVQFLRLGPYAAGCVFFPPGEEKDGRPSAAQILDAQTAAREAAAKADVVVGVSPWGMMAENALMREFAGYFQILLGGGPGVAVPGQAMNPGGVSGPLWLRADRMGGAVNVLDIYSLPEAPLPWLDGVHFSARLERMEKDLPEDAIIRALIDGAPRDAE